MPKILVTGAAGYIGSHACLALARSGYEVVGLDNLSTGRAEMVLPPARLLLGELSDAAFVRETLVREAPDGILHFAASIAVQESLLDPLKYYRNNVCTTATLVQAAVRARVPRFVFSSSAAVYGVSQTPTVSERSAVEPINPYGRTKLACEWLLHDAAAAHPGLGYACLRYFNVAGADPGGLLGNTAPNATHLIKLACLAALGKRDTLQVYGDDYPTPDGTCVRDYIHVSDLADVHVAVLRHLERGGQGGVYNCGYGRGFSVRHIVETVRRVSGVDFAVEVAPRRPGDPPSLVADASKLLSATGWSPRYNDIDRIVADALRWERGLLARS